MTTHSLRGEDCGGLAGKLHFGGDCNKLLLPYAVYAECGDETTDELRDDLQTAERMTVKSCPCGSLRLYFASRLT